MDGSIPEESAGGSQRVYSNNSNYPELDAKTVDNWNYIRNEKKRRQALPKKKYASEERHKTNANADVKASQKKIAKWRMRERVCIQ